MGTKVQSKSYLPGYYSMRDLNEDSKICWPLYQSDKSSQNGQYFMQRVAPEAYRGYDKDTVKQTMLEHEAVFKKQVYELHRLYRIQRDMMDEFRMKEGHHNRNKQSFSMVNSNAYHSHNGLSSKDVEVLESRPTKLRRKTFDLQLPADEYIDTEEGEKSRMPIEYGVKLFSRDRKVETQKSERCLRSPNGLADLNEPISLEDVKETNVSSYGLSNANVLDSDQSANPNLRHLGLAKEVSIRSYGSDGSIQSNSNIQKSGNGWLSHALEAGQRKSNLSLPQYLQTDKSPLSYQPKQVSVNNVHEPYFQCLDKSKSELWKEKTGFGVERTPDLNSSTSLASHISSYQISPPDLAKPWSHSWEKPSTKLNSAQTSLKAATLTQASVPSVQNDGIFGDRRCSAGDYLYRNGFHQGSSSGSKEQPIHIPSSSNENNRVSRNSADDCLANYNNVSDLKEMKSPKDMNLNIAISDQSSDQERTLAALPWLRAKPACKKELTDSGHFSKSSKTCINRSSLNQSPCKNQIAEDCNQQFASSGDLRVESSRSPNNNKILGFPIFEKPNISLNEASCLTSENKVVNRLSRILDINLPCNSLQQDDAEVIVESVTEAKSGGFRHHIDLNSCLSDDESSLISSAPIARVRGLVEIDLEVPAVPESEDEALPGEENEAPESSLKCNGPQEDELLTVAAEAIVAISVSTFSYPSETQSKESGFADPLTWFVEIVSSCGEGKVNDDLSEECDHFESMILQLAETKEEDYMPAPLIPDSLKLEEAGCTLLTGRPRKGQGRRGRQRRDFQRDILPGLASLSRLEVTEDLQIFGGLMRATGHSWHSGRRNGGGRGRRRAAVSPPSPPAPATPPCGPLQLHQLTSIEAGRDDRSLTGWGKTTRRPRRQRCPPSIPITL